MSHTDLSRMRGYRDSITSNGCQETCPTDGFRGRWYWYEFRSYECSIFTMAFTAWTSVPKAGRIYDMDQHGYIITSHRKRERSNYLSMFQTSATQTLTLYIKLWEISYDWKLPIKRYHDSIVELVNGVLLKRHNSTVYILKYTSLLNWTRVYIFVHYNGIDVCISQCSIHVHRRADEPLIAVRVYLYNDPPRAIHITQTDIFLILHIEFRTHLFSHGNDTHAVAQDVWWAKGRGLTEYIHIFLYSNGLVQDCGISSALALEIPQSCNKPQISCYHYAMYQ